MDRADLEGSLSARRLYVPALPELGGEVLLGVEAAQHARVLRLAVGDPVQLFDGQGGSVEAAIETLDKRGLRCVARAARVQVAAPPRVVLVQCVPRAGKLDDIVRMTTEVGVSEIALALSEYCTGRAGAGGREEHKRERLERIAVEAARQSEQAYVPRIGAPAPLQEVLARAPRVAYRAACVERSAAPLPATVAASELWLVVGPEGGLSPADRQIIADAGFVPVALGR